jgi:hypothetical protein
MNATDCLPAWGGFLFGHGTGYRGKAPTIGANLLAFYSPRFHRHQPAPARSHMAEFWGHGSRLSGPWPQATDVGLAEVANQDTPEKCRGAYGSLGLGSAARRKIQCAAAILEAHRACCALWTVTIPPDAMPHLCQEGAWSKFQATIRHRLVRLLKRRMGVALVVGVVEIHPQRSREAGFPIPHLHILFRGKRPGERRWRVRKEEFDSIIRQACEAVGAWGVSVAAAGNLARVRKSCAKYLSKYLTKRPEDPGSAGRGGPNPIRVCQWWMLSEPLGRLITDTTVPVDPAFLAWVADRMRTDEPLRGVFVGKVSTKSQLAPPWWRICFNSPEDLGLALWEWLGQSGEAPTALTAILSHGIFNPQRDSLQHQQLREAADLRGAGLPVGGKRKNGFCGDGPGSGASVPSADRGSCRQHIKVRRVRLHPMRSERAERPQPENVDGRR